MRGESPAVVKVRPALSFDRPANGWCERCRTTGQDGEYVATVLIDGHTVLDLIVCGNCAFVLGARAGKVPA